MSPHVSRPLPLRDALRRGIVLVLANWPIVLIDLGVSAFAQAMLIVPVAGGVLMVGAIGGGAIGERFEDGIVAVVEAVFSALGASPAALVAFLVATGVLWLAGDILSAIITGGTLGVVAEADRSAGDLGRRVIGETELVTARVFSAERVLAGARRFARPMTHLAVARVAGFVLLGSIYVAILASVVVAGPDSVWHAAWSAVLFIATSAGLVMAAAITLLGDLIRIAMVTDGCGLGTAVGRVRRFLMEDARQVLGIVSVIASVQIVASAVGLLAVAGLAPVAYLPVVSLAVVPLQFAFWLVRGLVIQFAALASVAACQTQYRRFSPAGGPADAATGLEP